MKSLKRHLLLTSLLLLVASQAYAYGTLSGKVIQVRVDRQGQGMVVFDTPIVNAPPACTISAYANAFAFDTNTAGGRAILATALAAKATDTVIQVFGTGACTTYGNYVEDWSYGVLMQ